MRKSLFVSCYYLRIEILINYLPIMDYFLKPKFSQRALSSFLGGDSQQSPPGRHFHFHGSSVHPGDYTLLLLTPTQSTPPLTEAGRAPGQQDAVPHQQGI